MFKKDCPKCKDTIIYASKKRLNISIKNNTQCLFCRRKEYRLKNKTKIANKKRQDYVANREERKKKRRNKYWEDVEKSRAYDREYYKNNREDRLETAKRTKDPIKVNEASARWRNNHKEQMNLIRKKWADENPEKVSEIRRRRRAKEAEVEENYTPKMEQITRKAFRNKCYNCGSDDDLCIDHHRPLTKGHALTISNAVVLCRVCNGSKSDRNPEDFYGLKKCEALDKKLNKIG